MGDIEPGVWHKDGPVAQIEAMIEWLNDPLDAEHRRKVQKNLGASADALRGAVKALEFYADESNMGLIARWTLIVRDDGGVITAMPGDQSATVTQLPPGARLVVVAPITNLGAVEALREYGGHRDDCPITAGAPDCDCGFDEAMLRALGRAGGGS